jgi:2,4-dienoyl-CoA reductase-like NADH-dependent reductase (Old Yellow Enzyme family)
MSINELTRPLVLPCGAVIKNRWMKSAMSEGLASKHHQVTDSLVELYRVWAQGGAGLLISGNVMIDHRALGEPRNVVIENEQGISMLQAWAQAGTQNGAHFWLQLNHPGKQSPKVLSPVPVAPSAVPFEGKLAKFFGTPRALTETEIYDVIVRFGESARIAKLAGFTGVQIHGAHGYLISQFLSPKHNQRRDQWGGPIDHRMRIVIEVYQQIRRQVGPDFPIGIKLNSADFQKGGFTEDESAYVILTLSKLGIDLIEISGGTYESPAMTGANSSHIPDGSTREAYFIEFAQKVKKLSHCPIALTGGFRSVPGMKQAITDQATDLIGIARAFVLEPHLPLKIMDQQPIDIKKELIRTGLPWIDRQSILENIWYEQQLARIGKGKSPDRNRSAWLTLWTSIWQTGWHIFQKRRAN